MVGYRFGILVLLAIVASAAALDKYVDFEESFDHKWDSMVDESFVSIDDKEPSSRIIGGKDAIAGQFPYQAGLRMNKSGSGSWCGGVLISDSHVLTAGHCAVNADFIDVYLGAIEIRNLTESGRLNIRVYAGNITVHKGYDPINIRNDIAIMRLPQPITFTDRIQPIALPSFSDAAVDFSYLPVVASGWGRTSDALGSSISDTLRFAEVRVQPEDVCHYYFGQYILPSNICTETSQGQGICNGDSGGPVALELPDGDRVLLGLSSFVSSIGCVKCWPSVFVRVSYFLDWIAANSDIKMRH